MRFIEFHDREREIKEIRSILDSRPTLITFIYGPINSGKPTRISHLIEEVKLKYENIIKVLDRFLGAGSHVYEMITPEITYLVEANIPFLDSVKQIPKPQSRLNLLVIQEVIANA